MEKKRILIADDERAVGIMLAEALKRYDYEIDVVLNGIEAIKQISRRSYDLIITDYMMPEMDGLELTQRVRSKDPSVPIVVVTGNRPSQDLLKSGVTACIMKPFSVFEIQNEVRNILNTKRQPKP
jgi:CheY-like chemotaxis protein